MNTIMSMPDVLTTTYDLACDKLDDMIDVLTEFTVVHGEDEPKVKVAKKEHDDMKFSDPPISQYKDKRISQLFKAPTDLRDAKKMRTCSYCHKK